MDDKYEHLIIKHKGNEMCRFNSGNSIAEFKTVQILYYSNMQNIYIHDDDYVVLDLDDIFTNGFTLIPDLEKCKDILNKYIRSIENEDDKFWHKANKITIDEMLSLMEMARFFGNNLNKNESYKQYIKKILQPRMLRQHIKDGTKMVIKRRRELIDEYEFDVEYQQLIDGAIKFEDPYFMNEQNKS